MPKRPCARMGCPALVERGYCERCKTASVKAIADRERETAAQRGYGSRWRATSKGFLAKHPLCVDPYKRHGDLVVPSEVTDHIVAHKGDMKLFWDPNNWQPLCGDCNRRKNIREEGGFGR